MHRCAASSQMDSSFSSQVGRTDAASRCADVAITGADIAIALRILPFPAQMLPVPAQMWASPGADIAQSRGLVTDESEFDDGTGKHCESEQDATAQWVEWCGSFHELIYRRYAPWAVRADCPRARRKPWRLLAI